MNEVTRRILTLLWLLCLPVLGSCDSSEPYFPVKISMTLNSPYQDAEDRDVQQVIEVDVVSGCTLFSRFAFQDEVPGVWPVETTRVVGSTGFVTFRSLFSCAEIGPDNPDHPYTFWDLQNDLAGALSTQPATANDPGSLIVSDSDVPLARNHSYLVGTVDADVELIFTQDPMPPTNPNDAMDRPQFIYNGVRLNPGLPIFSNPDTYDAVARCLVIDKIIVRPHDPGAPACP